MSTGAKAWILNSIRFKQTTVCVSEDSSSGSSFRKQQQRTENNTTPLLIHLRYSLPVLEDFHQDIHNAVRVRDNILRKLDADDLSKSKTIPRQ